MSQQVVERPTAVDRFLSEVLPPVRETSLVSSLPAHVKPERFKRNLYNALIAEPKLLRCPPDMVFREVSKLAAVGLLMDPHLGEAYLIADHKGGVQARIGYRGIIKLCRQSGEISAVYAHEICTNDRTFVSQGTNKRLEHEPTFAGERGNVVAFYAVVKFSDGEYDFDVMSLKDIERIRDRSDAWRAFKAGKIHSTPWGTDFDEMAKKTVIRRLLKRIPKSPDLADVLGMEDAADAEDMRDITPARPALGERLTNAPVQTGTAGFSVDHVQREIGGGIAFDEDSGTGPDSKEAEPEQAASNATDDGGADDVVQSTSTPKGPKQRVAGPESGQGGGSPPTESDAGVQREAESEQLADAPSGDEPRASEEPAEPSAGGAAAVGTGVQPPQRKGELVKEYTEYHLAIARTSGHKTLKTVSDQFRSRNAWTTEEHHLPAIKAIYEIHQKRINGDLTGDALLKALREIGAA